MSAAIISVLLLVSVLVILLFATRQHHTISPMQPGQKQLVLELIKELKKNRIDVILADTGGERHSASLNLFEARFYLDGTKELSQRRFDPLPVFFSEASSQVIDLKRFIQHPDCPEEIRGELQNFFNSNFSPLRPDYPYFIMITEVQDSGVDEASDNGLFKGDAMAFSTWLSFRECADSLNYVIGQWIREHEKVADSELYAEFL